MHSCINKGDTCTHAQAHNETTASQGCQGKQEQVTERPEKNRRLMSHGGEWKSKTDPWQSYEDVNTFQSPLWFPLSLNYHHYLLITTFYLLVPLSVSLLLICITRVLVIRFLLTTADTVCLHVLIPFALLDLPGNATVLQIISDEGRGGMRLPS